MDNFTFGVPLNDWGEQYYHPQAILGLGRNSTFLQTLKNNNMISSRTWSAYWGLDGTATGGYTNGSMIFGGYDAARISGPATSNYTGKLDYTACPDYGIAIEITDVSLFLTNGTSVSLYDLVSPVPTCVDPGAAGMMYLPYYGAGIMENFVHVTNYTSFLASEGSNPSRSFGLNFYNLLYFPEDDR